jgi:glycosyltransferase involved in cell wall biosynthesis
MSTSISETTREAFASIPGEAGPEEQAKAKTLLAIPAFNEELTIGSVVLKAREHVDEVLVIDDGSEDDTRRVATLASATVLSHRRNLGKGAAIRTAFDYVRRNGHEILVLIDGDGQHDSEEIPNLTRSIAMDEADVVVGTRWGKTNGMPFYRRVGKRMLDYATGAFTGFITDSQCGFRAFSRTAVDALDLQSLGFGVESEVLIRAREAGLRVVEVPVGARYDVDGSTAEPLDQGVRVVDSILRVVAEWHPLIFFGVPGLIVFLLGMVLGFHVMNLFNQTGVLATGYALIVAITMILGGLLILTGIILNILPRAIARQFEHRLP